MLSYITLIILLHIWKVRFEKRENVSSTLMYHSAFEMLKMCSCAHQQNRWKDVVYQTNV